MSEIPVSGYGNQKCACFIEIERLESQLASAKKELEKRDLLLRLCKDHHAYINKIDKELEEALGLGDRLSNSVQAENPEHPNISAWTAFRAKAERVK